MIVGGQTLSLKLNIEKMASIAPAAPRRWPVIDFVELTTISPTSFLKTDLIASVSAISPAGVEVPCAFI